MTANEYTQWCKFFRRQFVQPGEVSDFPSRWLPYLEGASLADAREAVMYCVRTASRHDVPRLLLPKILGFLRDLSRRRAAAELRPRYASYTGTRGQAWIDSPNRKRLAEMAGGALGLLEKEIRGKRRYIDAAT